MAKNTHTLFFLESRGDTVENLEAIRVNLNRCVEDGMVDFDASFYNELLALMDEAAMSKNWDELMEVITKAKTLEVDVAVFLSNRGQTSITLPWPKPPST